MAQFVRTHEKALANALQLQRQNIKRGHTSSQDSDASPTQTNSFQNSTPAASTSSTLAAAFSLGALSFTSQSIKPAKLTLTPHHLFYLLSRFEELGIVIGPMNVRLENIHADTSHDNYVSFLDQSQMSRGRSDRDSIHSVSSVRSVMSGMSSLWSSFGIGSSSNSAKTEKAKAQLQIDIKYLYSAFTKIPCLRLSPDRKARLIGGYEEFPFDTAVPLLAFKNISALEICDLDFRQFFGWDRLAEQLRSLTVKRGHVDDPLDLLTGIVLDDMDKRRRRSSKAQGSPNAGWPSSPSPRYSDFSRISTPGSPVDIKLGGSSSPQNNLYVRGDSDPPKSQYRPRTKSTSPTRPSSSRQGSSNRYIRGNGAKVKRSGSGSSTSSSHSFGPIRTRSSSNLLSMGFLPASKWRFLKHLSLADNGLTSISTSSLAPLAYTLHSLDVSSNLLVEVPDCFALLVALRALNLSNCMIESLHSLARNPLPAITALNLRQNRLRSIAGVERLLSLERLDLRDNRLADPTEIARLTGIPDIREIWVVGNPFVKTHGAYRITIFNLFRGTAGYADDIVIDATSPGYNERRQLRDRTVESEGVPVVKPLPADWGLTPDTESHNPVSIQDHLNQNYVEENPRPQPRTTQSEIAIGSGRRKRGPRRRIVDLSMDESQTRSSFNESLRKPQVAFADSSGDSTLGSDSVSLQKPKSTLSIPQSMSLEVPQDVPSSTNQTLPSAYAFPPAGARDKIPTLADELRGLNLNGESYRRKVESLKDEFGSAWLNILSRDNWTSREGSEAQIPEKTFSQVAATKPEIPSLQATNQEIASSGRTLG